MSTPTDTDFPTSLDDTTSLPNPTAADTTKAVPHAELHTVQNKAIIAIQTKIGTGSSTPTANKVLMGDGTGTSSWSSAVPEASINGLTTDLAAKANTADLAAVATSGSYNDLSDTVATSTDLTKLHDVTASAIELNILDGATLSTAELNYVDGVTSAIQTQLDGKAAALGSDDNYVTDAEKIVIGNTSGTNTGDQTTITGNAGSATKLATARTIAGVSFDGSANISIGIDGLSDVDTSTTAPTDAQVLTWNNTASKWEPADATGGSGSGGANLSASLTSTTVTVASDSGTDAVLASADSSNAGILTSADKVKLDAITGTNTGDQTITLTGDATGSGTGSFATVVGKINGVSLAGLATGILKNTTTTGVPSIAVAADFPTLNQNTTGSAAKLTTARAINGVNFDGTAAISIPGVKWTNVTTTTQTAAINNGYIANNAAQVTITLPSTYAIGTTIRVAGAGAGGWKIAQPTGSNIVWGPSTTTTGTGGSLTSANKYDAVELLAIVANTTWVVVSSQGNITVT